MKAKIISLAVAAVVGLSACNSGSSSPTTTEGTVSTNTVSSNNPLTRSSLKAAPEPKPLFKNGFLNWIWESNKGTFGMAFAAFPATWAASLLQNLIFGVQEDISVKYMKEISEKLDTILTNLEASMNISAISLDTISEFYKAYTGNALTDSFTSVQTSINDVQAKYSEFTKANVFGSDNSSVTDLRSLYLYAGQHCDDVAIIDATDVTSSTTGTDSQYDVDTMFTTFTTIYSAESSTLGEASAYKKVATAKTNYKNAMVSTFPKTQDFMSYIRRYNYTVKYYGMNLLASYQKLYNMQLAQLAYHYACNSAIEFSNLGNLSGSGESGFEQSVTNLNTEYAAKFTNLNSNVNNYFSSISNTEIYTMINTQIFSSSKPLLNSTTFNNNVADLGTCTVSQLKFNQTYTNSGSSNGIIDLNAICVKSKTGNESETKYESATIYLDIPYHSSEGKTIDRYGLSNIKYDSANDDFTNDINTDFMTSDDMKYIAYENRESYAYGYYWANKESMNIIAPSFYEEGSGTKLDNDWDKHFQGFYISSSTDELKFYTNAYNYIDDLSRAEEDYKDGWGNFSIFDYLPDYTNSDSAPSFNASYISRGWSYLEGKKGFGKDYTNPWDAGFGYEYWTLGSYHGKTFVVKIVFQQVAETGKGAGSYVNRSIVQAMGIFCLNNKAECTRADDGGTDLSNGDDLNKTTLTWTDGTQVIIDSDPSYWMNQKTLAWTQYKHYISGSVSK